MSGKVYCSECRYLHRSAADELSLCKRTFKSNWMERKAQITAEKAMVINANNDCKDFALKKPKSIIQWLFE